MISTIFFDLVGTIVEETSASEVLNIEQWYYEIQVKAIYRSLEEAGISLDWSLFKNRYGQVRAEQREESKRTLREYDMCRRVSDTLAFFNYRIPSSSPIITKVVDAYVDLFLDTLEVQQSTYSVLDELRSEFELGLVTNFAYPPGAYRVLDRFALNPYFRAVLISGEVGWKKPSPHIFHVALSEPSAKPEEAVFVGDDHEADIVGAKSVGMKTVFLAKERQKSEESVFVIQSLVQLPSLVRRLSG